MLTHVLEKKITRRKSINCFKIITLLISVIIEKANIDSQFLNDVREYSYLEAGTI